MDASKMFDQAKDIILKNINYKAMAAEAFAEIVKPAARELAAKSENKIDDVAVELLLSALDKVVAELQSK